MGHAAVRKWTEGGNRAMVSKQELPGFGLTIVVALALIAGGYAAGRHDESGHIVELVDVRCERPVMFKSLGGSEPAYHHCKPNESVKFEGDHGVVLVLP